MEALGYLFDGFVAAAQPFNLLCAFIGVFLGTLVGVLPGIGPTSGIAILLPLTGMLGPAPAIIMLAGIYYGAMYGGSTTSILVNMPGEISSVVTTLDGYQMAKQGRAGPALAIAAIASFAAGSISLLGLTFFAPSLADLAVTFGPPEYFMLMVLALTVVISLAGDVMVKGLIAGLLGFIIISIGTDPISGNFRFTFGSMKLLSGIDFVVACIGLFALGEIFINTEQKIITVFEHKIGRLLPTLRELRQCLMPTIRSTFIGFFMGLLPGVSTGVTSFIAYDVEKKISKHPEQFGNGAIEGVAVSEGANNAATSGAFVPLMALGLPPGPSLAVLLGAFMIYGLQPGPLLFQMHADFAWTIIASMYIGNVMLLILNLPLVGLWVRIALLPYPILASLVIFFSFIGAFSIRNSLFDLWLVLIFGVLGYLMKKFKYPQAPLILCMVLAPKMEASFYQALKLGNGSAAIFFQRPVSVALMVASIFGLVLSIWFSKRKHVPLGSDD